MGLNDKADTDAILVFNAVAIKTGGGMQKTTSLLDVLSRNVDVFNSCVWVVVEGSALSFACDRYGFSVKKIANGKIARLKAELFLPLVLSNNAVFFNLGGTCMLTSIFNKINISECAYSNLFYPEISFWKYEPRFKRYAKFIIDCFRIIMIGFSDEIIFQTEEIRNRASEMNLLPINKMHVIKPAVSSVMNPNLINVNYSESLIKSFSKKFTFLFACGDQKNKRIQNLPFIAAKMKILNPGFDFIFIITLSSKSDLKNEIVYNSRNLDCENNFNFIGQRTGSEYASLLSVVDAVCNFAVLESFSNNFLEAWSFEKPLIASCSSWAIAAAGNSAYYVSPDDIDSCAEKLNDFYLNPELRIELIKNGRVALSKHPTPEQKAEQYLSLLLDSVEKRSFKEKLLTVKNWLSYFLRIRERHNNA